MDTSVGGLREDLLSGTDVASESVIELLPETFLRGCGFTGLTFNGVFLPDANPPEPLNILPRKLVFVFEERGRGVLELFGDVVLPSSASLKLVRDAENPLLLLYGSPKCSTLLLRDPSPREVTAARLMFPPLISRFKSVSFAVSGGDGGACVFVWTLFNGGFGDDGVELAGFDLPK